MSDFWNDEPYIQDQLQEVRNTIEQTVATAHGFIRPILEDHVRSTGKMLRPALVIITSMIGDADRREDAIRVGSVIELIHLASLVHDDIIDGAQKRRGRTSVFAKVGAKQAVLAGDFLLAKALMLTSGKERGMDSEVVSRALTRLCESELDQDAGQGDFFIDKSTYLRRIGGKTASLFALSCYSGVALQELGNPMNNLCHHVGYCMGMAFQIQDDILDYVGSSKKLGKHTGGDVKSGIPTLPLILALQAEEESGTHALKDTLSNKKIPLDQRTTNTVLSLVEELGGIQKAQILAESYKKRALEEIHRIGNRKVEKILISLFEKLSARSV
ncbi:MAG: polyprenyl synthetase family protein [Sphaerochaeta sp.]